MSIFTLSPVTSAEIDRVMEIIAEAQSAIKQLGIDQWQDGYPQKEIMENDISENALWGAYVDGRLAAVSAIFTGDEPIYANIDGAWITQGPYVTVHRMAAADEARGRGAALRLMEKAAEIGENTDCASIRIDTHLGNVVMRRFLEKQRFEMCGIVDYTGLTEGDPLRVAYEKCLKEKNR